MKTAVSLPPLDIYMWRLCYKDVVSVACGGFDKLLRKCSGKRLNSQFTQTESTLKLVLEVCVCVCCCGCWWQRDIFPAFICRFSFVLKKCCVFCRMYVLTNVSGFTTPGRLQRVAPPCSPAVVLPARLPAPPRPVCISPLPLFHLTFFHRDIAVSVSAPVSNVCTPGQAVCCTTNNNTTVVQILDFS